MEDDGNGPVKYDEMYKDLKGLLENLNEVVFLEAGTDREAHRRGKILRHPVVMKDLDLPSPICIFGINQILPVFTPPVVGGYSDLHLGAPAGFHYLHPRRGGDAHQNACVVGVVIGDGHGWMWETLCS